LTYKTLIQAQFPQTEFSFVDNGDQTVTDLTTELIWQQTPTNQTFGWQEAQDYCQSLTLAGYDDWRTPSLKELFSISNFQTGWPYINTSFFDLAQVPDLKQNQYWSSNFYESGTTHNGAPSAFGVNHGTGHIKAYPAEGGGGPAGKYVRCVQGEEYGINELINNQDETITDNATELMWTQYDSQDSLDWEQALLYANNSTIAGYTDWRLPNVKEMQSIVDYSLTTHPAIDPMFECTGIINEAGVPDYGYYWTSTSALFEANEPYYYAWYVAFGKAVDGAGEDMHGAGAVRFDTKHEDGPLGEGGERFYNYVRLVRNIDTSIGYNDLNQQKNSLNIYPNPVKDILSINMNSTASGFLKIYNYQGQIVYRQNIQSEADLKVNVRYLPSGLYIIMINDTNGVSGGKFLK